MRGLLEVKDYVGTVKDVDVQSNTISGYLAVFGNVDHDNDITEKGSFAKSIRERGPEGKNSIFFLNQHNWNQPHGKFTVLQEDDYGLYFESKLNPKITYSSDALELYREGVLDKHSYGWITVKSEERTDGVRLLKENYLMEGSNVTLPANDMAGFTGFKSLITLDEISQKSKSILKVLRTGNLTDDTFFQLEIALKQLELQAYEMGKKDALETQQPDASTASVIEPQKSDDEAIYNQLKNFSILN